MKPRDYTRLTQEKITTKARKNENTKGKGFFSCTSSDFVSACLSQEQGAWLDKDEV
jgi:hypothetical protein